jgi:hypothetical protein
MTRRVVALLTIVLATIVVEPATAATRVDHGHASSLYSASRASLRLELRRFERHDVDLVTWTEIRERAKTLRRVPAWRTFAPTRRTDVAISWRRGIWHVVHRRPFLLTRRTWDAPNGRRPIYGALAVLDRGPTRVLVTVGHMPSHVEYGDDFRVGFPDRVGAWVDALDRWSRRIATARRHWRPDVVLVVADWNTDVRRATWRTRLLDAFPQLSLTWKRPLPDRGTHRGRRLIDATLTNARGRAHLLRRTTASDHRPYIERLSDSGP